MTDETGEVKRKRRRDASYDDKFISHLLKVPKYETIPYWSRIGSDEDADSCSESSTSDSMSGGQEWTWEDDGDGAREEQESEDSDEEEEEEERDSSEEEEQSDEEESEDEDVTDQVDGRTISQLAEDAYQKHTNIVSMKPRKVLAAVVMRRRGRLAVVALGTGTTCIGGADLSKNGYAVNDCHAEVVVRRTFVAYLYSQLEMFATKPAKSIFNRSLSSQKFELKPGVLFHLYISTIPCGDAAVFPAQDDPLLMKSKQRRKRGRARAKIDMGEAAVYPPTTPQLWDGIKNGSERLYTMSCSDKLARWNVLGMQGSLLSIYTGPIYVSSITVGREFILSHMRRAVSGRLQGLSHLPGEYQVNSPKLLKGKTAANVTYSSDISLNWSLGLKQMERINCRNQDSTGKRASRLCKRSLFERFLKLWDICAPKEAKTKAAGMIFPRKTSRPMRSMTSELMKAYLTYGEVKSLATEYARAKAKLFEHYVEHCGAPWAKKPPEQDDFRCV